MIKAVIYLILTIIFLFIVFLFVVSIPIMITLDRLGGFEFYRKIFELIFFNSAYICLIVMLIIAGTKDDTE